MASLYSFCRISSDRGPASMALVAEARCSGFTVPMRMVVMAGLLAAKRMARSGRVTPSSCAIVSALFAFSSRGESWGGSEFLFPVSVPLSRTERLITAMFFSWAEGRTLEFMRWSNMLYAHWMLAYCPVWIVSSGTGSPLPAIPKFSTVPSSFNSNAISVSSGRRLKSGLSR